MRVLQSCQPWHHGITGFMKKDNGTGIRLMPRDVAIWLAIVERLDYRTGHCDLTLKQISEATDIPHNFVCTGMTRLKKLMLAINQYNPKTGARWILVNPSILWSGSEKRTRILEQEWQNAWTRENAEDIQQQMEDEEWAERTRYANREIDRKIAASLEASQ